MPSALKDQLSVKEVKYLQACLEMALPGAGNEFAKGALAALEDFELKSRVTHLIECLHQVLPRFGDAAPILLQMGNYWRAHKAIAGVSNFGAWPIIDYASVYGLESPDLSLPLLKALTDLYTSEFAIRPFVARYPQKVFSSIHRWINHECEHVRRLCSEGIRPRLPWADHLGSFKQSPEPIFEVLVKLMNDPSRYVQKSVANNLNDISKDQPQKMLKFCKQQLSKPKPSRESLWIIKHGLRTLIKTGDLQALDLLGFDLNPKVKVSGNLSRAHISVGEAWVLTLALQSQIKRSQSLVIDYKIGFVTAHGKLSYRIYKLKNIILPAGEIYQLNKAHDFSPKRTRCYHAGTHKVAVMVNGTVVLKLDFLLDL